MLQDIHFFSAELWDGHLMSRPKYEPEHEFMGNLVHEIETKKPAFAWVQFVFQNADYSDHLLRLKSGLSWFKREAAKPIKRVDGEGKEHSYDRKEVRMEWYRTAEAKMKKIDEATGPTIVMSIRGMWVGGIESLESLTTFANCKDEHDRLMVIPIKDPRTLLWLVKRRMVVHVGEYFDRYNGGGRLRAPSLVLTSEELPYYIHMPAGKVVTRITSLKFGSPETPPRSTKEPEIIIGGRGQEEQQVAEGPSVTFIKTVPVIKETPKEDTMGRLRALASHMRRSFELLYDPSDPSIGTSRYDRPMKILLYSESGRDLLSYQNEVISIYGADFAPIDPVPHYVSKVVEIVAKEA